jgi:hypothetical protein
MLVVVAGALMVGGVAVACGHRSHGPIAPLAVAPSVAPDATRVVSFDDLPLGQAPAGFTCAAPGPEGVKPAKWQVVAAADAPSGKQVLEQSDGDDTNNRFPIALFDGREERDVRVAVKAKAISGARDRSFGVVLRARDARNYYVARANTSEWGENVRFYTLVDGKRSQLDAWDGPVAPGAWHSLQVDALGDDFVVTLDGKAVLRVHDTTFPAAGRAGVWTKAESISQFDDLSITPLTGAATGSTTAAAAKP